MSKPTKQVIVIRKELKMRAGKQVAQGAHASMAFLSRRVMAGEPVTEVQREWMNDSYRKICLQVDSLEALRAVEAAAISAGVECHVMTDSGLTEFHGVPTVTCLALGPDYDEKIDPIAGHLKLY